MISHGTITHKIKDRYDCLECIQVEIDLLEAIKKAGGKTKFKKHLH